MTEEELPPGWICLPLGEAAVTTSGGTPSRRNPAFFEGSIPWIKSGELPDGQIRSVSENLSQEGIKNSAARIVPSGTLMIAMYGATVGKLGISTFPASTNQAICSIMPIGLHDRNFLYFFLLAIRRKLIDDAKGGAQPNISQEIIRRIAVPTPPLNEQRRIVERIDELFSQIEAGEAALARAKRLLARYRQAVLKAAVTGELTRDWRERHEAEIEPADQLLARILQARREAWEKAELEKLRAKGKKPKDDKWKAKYKEPAAPDTSDLAELPEGWVWASLDSVSSHLTSGSRAWKAFYDQGESTFVMAQNVRPGRYDHSYRQAIDPPKNDPETERTRCQIDDILITIVGANTGNTCRFDIDVSDHYVCQSVALVRPSLAIWSGYLNLYFLAEKGGQARFDRYIYGAGRPHLSFADLKQTAICLPHPAEMLEITSRIEAILAELDMIEAELQIEERRAAALRQSILTAAFAGKLVPQDPADEPAPALLARIRANRAEPAPRRRGRKPSSERERLVAE